MSLDPAVMLSTLASQDLLAAVVCSSDPDLRAMSVEVLGARLDRCLASVDPFRRLQPPQLAADWFGRNARPWERPLPAAPDPEEEAVKAAARALDRLWEASRPSEPVHARFEGAAPPTVPVPPVTPGLDFSDRFGSADWCLATKAPHTPVQMSVRMGAHLACSDCHWLVSVPAAHMLGLLRYPDPGPAGLR